jgi:hypothetical protein
MRKTHHSITSEKTLPAVRKYYPNAINIDRITDELFDIFKSELGLKPNQIIHADSICSDDVNNIEYPEHARQMLGPFNLGGLCGFPFTGITGITAFAHHVPKNGAVMIYYGPHIGVSKQGEVGKLLRVGQSLHSSCCGAVNAAIKKLFKDEIIENEITELDYQQNIIEQILFNHKERIEKAEHPIFEATEVLFNAIENRVNELATKTDYPCKHIILVGGIIINSDYDAGSYFECRTFKIIDTETGISKDVISLIELS